MCISNHICDMVDLVWEANLNSFFWVMNNGNAES